MMNRVPNGGAPRSKMLAERSQSDGISVQRNRFLRSTEPGVVAKLMGLEAMPYPLKPPAGTTPIKVLLPRKGGRSMESSLEEKKKMLQDALEVLSLNRDAFLDDPNSLLSKNLKELRALNPPTARSRRITVLKPSKSMNPRGEKPMKHEHYLGARKAHLDPSFARRRLENPDQSTRIVVLKPNPGKLRRDVSSGGLEATGSVEVSEEIAGQSLNDHRRDDSIFSSIVPNEYVGQESFFRVEDKSGDFSDSEIASQYSMSSASSSSFNWASRLPPESVMRDAKKRRSERFANVASYGCSSQELRHIRSTSNLAEMLAVREFKKGEKNHGEGEAEGDSSTSITCLYGEGGDNSSPRNLSRSKSVPVSSSTYEDMNIDAPRPAIGKNFIPKEEEIKPTSSKSTLKERLSSIFFSRGKKSNDKSILSPLAGRSEGGTKHPGISPKSPPSLDKIGRASEGSSVDDQEEPSPVSVLEAPFGDDMSRSALDSSRKLGSMRVPKHHLRPLPPSAEEEEQERFLFFRKLLSSAGSSFDDDATSVAFSRWHSPESPLDPALLDAVMDLKRQGAKWREKRSHQRLLFNCVNAALLEMGVAAMFDANPARNARHRSSPCSPSSPEEAWRLLKGWFSSEEAPEAAEEGSRRSDNSTIDRAVWAEVLAGGWTEWIWSEVDAISNDIGAKLLDELIEEISEAVPVSICIGRCSS